MELNFKKIIVFFFILVGCQQEKAEWNPVFEETGFDYFNTNIERSLSLIDEAVLEADKVVAQEKLKQAKTRLLEIKDYYVPLTTIRQKIYDAERYFKLDDVKKAKKLLNDSITIITALDLMTRNNVFDKVILGLTSMINEVLTSLNEGSKPNTYNKMKALSEHVNLMIFRGDLVLSGIEFDR